MPITRKAAIAERLWAPESGARRSDQLRALAVARAHLRGPAGEAGTRDRARRFALGALGLGGRRRQLGLALLFDAEDLLLALAVEQGEELLLLDRLALDEDPGDL